VSHPFNPRLGPIVIEAEVTGPKRSLTLPLILDTGATTSLLKDSVLTALGFDLASVTHHVQMTTGSHVTSVPRVVLTRMTALGQTRIGLPVLAHALPAGVSVSGLLGLDFLRDQILTIDFRSGLITLTA
jgi:predicted aspartyl protease